MHDGAIAFEMDDLPSRLIETHYATAELLHTFMLVCFRGRARLWSMQGGPVKISRTQEERTSATRSRLIEATLDLLLSEGYPAATTVDIAARAGLTRGALSHHFESKDELVVEAIDHLLKTTTVEIRVYAGQVGMGTLSISDFVDRLWTIFSGPFFMVSLEHITASRHNNYLKTRLVERTRDFHKSLDEIWRQFFSGTALNSAEVETTLNATLCLLRGMGVQTVLRNDPVYYRRLLRFWKSTLIDQIKASRRLSTVAVK